MAIILQARKFQGVHLHQHTTNVKMNIKTEWEVKIVNGQFF
jgi:hypothetical protein